MQHCRNFSIFLFYIKIIINIKIMSVCWFISNIDLWSVEDKKKLIKKFHDSGNQPKKFRKNLEFFSSIYSIFCFYEISYL